MNARLRVGLWLFLAACVVVVGSAPVLASLVLPRRVRERELRC